MQHQEHPGFTFKQFHIAHDGCAMKVGTDGILLGAWSHLEDACRILDIGCGSGLITLMAAQRSASNTTVEGIDIDADAVSQAALNASFCPWYERLLIHHCELSEFEGGPFSHQLSNPPYFVPGQHFSDPRRAVARHTQTLSHIELLEHSARLATADGQLSLILPTDAAYRLIGKSASTGWYLKRCCEVATNAKSPQIQRVLLTFSRQNGTCLSEQLSIYQSPGVYSRAFEQICRDFYLKM
ncbi:MAG: tRNA1(Val) (adenine(37)-N6)-methyltransferase [Candidatus Celerinatantimonas neptuna]|nr:MAG: tRNA1(Val) (adenine(37)-N6)-methyltransferase [Candidatus Celerinatantimonas neptuna]